MTIQPFHLCKKCNNQLNKDGSCPYCIWKGDEGPGLELKQIVIAQRKQEEEKMIDQVQELEKQLKRR